MFFLVIDALVVSSVGADIVAGLSSTPLKELHCIARVEAPLVGALGHQLIGGDPYVPRPHPKEH